MSIQVKSIDVYSIEEKLRKDKELKDVWQYVKALKEALARQQELTGKAIGKLREVSRTRVISEGEVIKKAEVRYGTDIHLFGKQRDGYVVGYTAAMKELNSTT